MICRLGVSFYLETGHIVDDLSQAVFGRRTIVALLSTGTSVVKSYRKLFFAFLGCCCSLRDACCYSLLGKRSNGDGVGTIGMVEWAGVLGLAVLRGCIIRVLGYMFLFVCRYSMQNRSVF